MSMVTFFGIQAIFIVSMSLFFFVMSRAASRDEEREAARSLRPDGEAAAVPRFFSRERKVVPGGEPTIDDLAVERLEGYLRHENARAEEFVSEPSIARLYRDSERRIQFN